MSPLSVALIWAACLCLTNAVPLTDDKQSRADDDIDYRLPLTIEPVNYNINIMPYLNESHPRKFTFDGECYIEIRVKEKTNAVKLHMKNLNVTLAEYYAKNSQLTKKLPTADPNTSTDIVTYILAEQLLANASYILHFKYVGSMDEDMHGFYRSSYTTSSNETKWLGSTQFETHHARRAFPSFDEPKFKATFDLSLTRHRSLRTVGPTRLIKIVPDGEYVTDVYATTPSMSTYILAFIFSEFNDRSDGQFAVLARPEYYAQTAYSFEVGKPLLAALGDYFDFPYYAMGNDKMHLAAIPDFSAGAMENWGLLTFRERALLYDSEHSPLTSKQYIASVVAHEQTHMWFGDLVTCEFWSYTWLNEAFARYFQYFGTDMVESYYELSKQFVVDQIHSVMGMDATYLTNPMSDENCKKTSDFSRMFNSISYNKGATFVRMNEKIMGSQKFRNALREYLKTYKYQNTKPANLFDVLKRYWPTNFVSFADRFFASYTTQVGYPVVTVNRTSDTIIKISQKRFLLKDVEKDNASLTYTVPFTYTTSIENNFQEATPSFFLENVAKTINVNPNTTWVIANIQESGYYRVNYDSNSWHQIHQALLLENWSGIHELNRAQIVNDILNLARAGEVDYSLALQVIEYLKTEVNYLPWTAAFTGLNFLSIRLGTDINDFGNYIGAITTKAYNELGFEEKKNDTALDIYARSKILSWSCKYGKNTCASKAKAYFNENLKTNSVPVNIRAVVYCTAMREGNETDFDVLYHKFKTEKVATEETLILTSLGCVKSSTLVSKYFHKIISPEIRRQDKSSALSSLYSSNPENIDVVFDLINENIDQVAAALGDYQSVASQVDSISEYFTTEDQLNKLKAFMEQHKNKLGSSLSTLETTVKSVEYNLEWSNSKLPPIKKYLEQYKTNGASANSISLFSAAIVALLAMVLNQNY